MHSKLFCASSSRKLEESKKNSNFFWLPLQLLCKTRLETLATQAMPKRAVIFKTAVVV